MSTTEDLAKVVMESLVRRGVEIPDDDYQVILEYTEDGMGHLRSASYGNWNPEVHAPSMAQDAIRAYVEARYTGTPVYNSEVPFATQAWMNAAAGEYHKANV